MGAASRLKKQKMHKTDGGSKSIKVNEYNAKGAPEVEEAENKKEGFKHGGAKKKEAGHAEGKKAKHHLGKMKRGGAAKKMAAGGSPFTAAKNRAPAMKGGSGEGHDSAGPKGRDPEAD